MILTVSAYTAPFRALLTNPDGSLVSIYRPAQDTVVGSDLYAASWKDLVQGLLKDGVHPEKIFTVVVIGKPLIFFEKFLYQSLIPPTPLKMYRFAKGVESYILYVLRISNQISDAFRYKPDICFVSVTDVLQEISARAEKYDNILFWNIQSEIGSATYYRKSEQQLMTFPWLEKMVEHYRKEKSPERCQQILDDALTKLNWQTPGLLLCSKQIGKRPGASDRDTASMAEETWVPLLATATDIYLQLSGNPSPDFPHRKTSEDISHFFPLLSELPNAHAGENQSTIVPIWGADSRFKIL